MTDDGNNTPIETEDGIDLAELVGSVLDARGLTTDRISKLDTLDSIQGLPASIQEALTGAFTPASESTSGKFDEASFLTKLEGIIDGKLASLPTGTPAPEKKKALAAWLGIA